MNWLWGAPLVAAALHIGEEFVYPGGFATWDREYRSAIRSSITPRLHLVVNSALLIAYLSVAIAGMPGGRLVVSGIRLRSVVSRITSLAIAARLFEPGINTGLAAHAGIDVSAGGQYDGSSQRPSG